MAVSGRTRRQVTLALKSAPMGNELVDAIDLTISGTQTLAGQKTFDTQPRTTAGVGAVAGTGVSLASEQFGNVHQTVITLTALAITVTDTGGANGGYGTQKIYDFPEGNLVIMGAVSNLTAITAAAGISATATVKHSLGTAAEATNDTLDSTQANLIPSSSSVLVGSAGTGTGLSTAQTILNGTATAVDAILNIGVADAGISSSSSVTITGTVTITWVNLGDV